MSRPNPVLGYELLLDRGPSQSFSHDQQHLQLPVTEREKSLRRKNPSVTGAAKHTDSKKAGGPARGVIGQPPSQARQKDKFVPLPSGLATAGDSEEGESGGEGGDWPTAVPAQIQAADKSRVTAHCLAESFDRQLLEELIHQVYVMHGQGYTVNTYVDVVHLALTPFATSPRLASMEGKGGTDIINNNHQHSGIIAAKRGQGTQDAFFFNFGVVITFGLDKKQVADLLHKVAYRVMQKPYSVSLREVDEFQVQDSATEPPHIKNDTFTINKRQAKAHAVRLSIAYALAQSSKLSVYEEQVWDLVEATKHLPEIMAQSGKVAISPKAVTRLIGQVFLQAANVNLVSSVLDTPPFFWSAPDHLQELYDRACEYLELEARVEVLNTRFQVLQELLDMLRNQQNNFHSERLEMIIIWLLVVDCVLMLFQGFDHATWAYKDYEKVSANSSSTLASRP